MFYTHMYKPPTQPVRLWHRYIRLQLRLHHKNIWKKCCEIRESAMNQGQVCPFGPELCQNVAMASRNPFEPLWTTQPPKTKQMKNQNSKQICLGRALVCFVFTVGVSFL